MVLYMTLFCAGGTAGYVLAVFSFAAKDSEVELKRALIMNDLRGVLNCLEAELGRHDADTVQSLKEIAVKIESAYQTTIEL